MVKNITKNNIKVLLTYPEYEEISHYGANKRKEIPPFGVLYLATAARMKNAEVTVLPIKLCMPIEKYNLEDYEIVAMSIPSSVTYSIVKDFISKAKFGNNTLKIVGGIHATLFPHNVLEELNVDIVSIGEGEITLQEIIDNYPLKIYKNIKGILYKENNKIITTEKRPLEENLDVFGFPARELLSDEYIVMNRLSDTNIKMAHIMCSRGCPNKCAFCCNLDRNIRYRSGKHVKKELEYLIQTYGIKGFCIIDDNFIMNNSKVLDIIDNISSLNLKWSALSRINGINEYILKKAKQAGCIEIKYGVESGSQEILNKMNKKITIEEIIKTITLTHDLGIKTKIFLIHGFPGENIKTTEETIELLKKLKDKIDRISLFRFTPLPGSDVYVNPKKYDIIVPENFDDLYIYNNQNIYWGTENDKREIDESYSLLSNYIMSVWGKL